MDTPLVIYRVRGLGHRLCSALAPGRDWAPVIPSSPETFDPGFPTLVPAVRAVQAQVAASAHGLPGLAAGLVENAEVPADLSLSLSAVPAFLAEQVRALFVLSAASSAAEPPCHEADTGNAHCVASAAALRVDTCLLNTAADRQEAGHAPELRCASICPIRDDADPIHGPNADPSGVAHQTATL
jgi:hypothetical protein